MAQFQRVTEAAKRRAASADPNSQRCLVENCPKDRGVVLTHVYPRETGVQKRKMRGSEWYWKMRKGTLHLDTRHNMFFLGASLHTLFNEGRWALLPEESIIKGYFDSWDIPCLREDFPEITGPTFQYRFQPIWGMESIGITRQTQHPPTTAEASFTNHIYPFTTLPPLTSHIHPTFAILRLGLSLQKSVNKPEVSELIKEHPLIKRCLRLARHWSLTVLPPGASRDPTFVSQSPLDQEEEEEENHPWDNNPYDEDNDENVDDDEWESSDGDSICTPPRRIRFRKCPEPRTGKRPLESGCHAVMRPVGRPTKVRKLTSLIPKPKRIEGSDDEGWTKDTIASWAQGCSDSPPPPTTTSRNEE